jgi:hypothetical protein
MARRPLGASSLGAGASNPEDEFPRESFLMNTELARSTVGAARKLSRDLAEGVFDVILSNASRIRGFNARRQELAEVNGEYLFYYALGLVMFFGTIRRSWGDQEVNAVLEAAADDLSSQTIYTGASTSKAPEIRARVLANARNMFEAIRDHFEQAFADKGNHDDTFNFLTLHLMRAFPGAMSLMTEGHVNILTMIMQVFGPLSLAAASGMSPETGKS